MKSIAFLGLVLLGVYNVAIGQDVQAETLEVFSVKDVNGKNTPDQLTFKQIKYFNSDGTHFRSDFYEVDNTLKGFEVVKKEGASGESNYFDEAENVLAMYALEYNDHGVVTKTGYDGQTKEHLRTEKYQYNVKGELIQKSILDASGNVRRIYNMRYDEYGNEISLETSETVSGPKQSETYEITELDNNNAWLQKWGYVNNEINSFHRRSFKTIN